ncbi:MAG: polyketide synthase, partial [Desulfobacteraceae bacterium]|nr:polyketide synthase [Desulfobacteraceae bacterium]
MKRDIDTIRDDSIEGIAVIGLAGRFPGAKNINQFWQNLRNGVESIIQFTDEELKAQGVPPEKLNDPNYVKAGTIIEDGEKFDATLFGYTPREAEILDPQQRIFLETAWEALENAGYDADKYDGPVGVFAGVNTNDYVNRLLSGLEPDNVARAFQILIGNDKDFLSTRVSYKLNLKGPSLTVQSACSTSLVAVQLACQSLLNYQCSIVLAGGVSINLNQRNGYYYQEGTIVSPDGHCRAFDAKANGTVLGQGVGIVVLKRLSDALADGDTIHAVIKGFATNNDGALKAGYTVPSVDGQAEVIAMALALSGVTADSIDYVETHGTGTPLGDPVEIAALT